MYILLAQRRHIFLEKCNLKKIFWELTVYVQVYLFIILYSYWIATNIIQYLLYLVVFVYEYLSVFTQLYLRKWGQPLCNLSLEIQGPFMGKGGTPILRHGRKVPRWWPPFLWLSIWFGPYCIMQPPLSAEIISLCLSHLVTEIWGHKVGLI